MTEWREVTLGQALDVKHGYAFKGQFFSDKGELIVLTPGNFHEAGGFKPKSGTEKYYMGPVPDGFVLRRGDVVIAMTEQAQGLLGSSATIPEDSRYLHNQRIGLLQVVDTDRLDLRFCYHLMNTPAVRQQIQATATGSKVRHTAPERIRAVRANLPSVETQRNVADVLDTCDNLIENIRRRADVLEHMAQAIYREWFIRFRFPGHEHVSLVDSPLGPIPGDWRVSTCGDELAIHGGGTPSKKEPSFWDGGTIPWYTPSDLTKRPSRFAANPDLCITTEGLRKSSARLFPPGSVLMTSRATLGVLAVATAPSCCNQGFIVILPGERWPAAFIYEWLDDHSDELASLGTGATFKEITKGTFKKVPFLVPEPEIVDAFRSVVAPIDAEILALERGIRNLVEIRDLLLPKLVTGQIDVSDLDLDAAVGSVA